MNKIRKIIGVFLAKYILPQMNRLTLRVMGWKKEIQVHRLHGFVITRLVLWRNPVTGEAVNEETAVTKCKESVT